ncbi:AAA family ATPase [Streptomyces sp. NPDC002845]
MSGPLREREEAYELLAAETGRARAGTGRLVLLRGATGTGRTAVLEAAVEHAEAHGMRVLRARCSPEDTALPFSAVLQFLGPVSEFADLSVNADERASAARLWRLLRSYAAEGPLLVAVDDVHLADGASRRWLTEAARRIDGLPALLVVTERSQYDIAPPSAGLTHALSPTLVRTHTLAPLTDASAAALVRTACPDVSPHWVDDCVRAGAGSPLLLHALLDDLRAAGRPTTLPETSAALYPGAYPAAVSWWLDSTGTTTAEVARALAALDEGWSATGPGAAPNGTPRDLSGSAPGGIGTGSPATTPDGTSDGSRVSTSYGASSGRSASTPGGVRSGSPATRPGGISSGAAASVLGGAWSGFLASTSYGTSYGTSSGPSVSTPGGIRSGPSAHVPECPRRDPSASSSGPTHAPFPVPALNSVRVPAPTLTPDPAWTDLPCLLAEMTGADPARVTGWLTAMARLGLLRPDAGGRPRYAHPLLRDAVLTGVSAARRQAVHRAAAEAMLRRGAETETVARQLLRADTVGAPWAMAVLQESATMAVHAARGADAVAYLRRALDEPMSDDARQRLLIELGSLEYAVQLSSASSASPAGLSRFIEALRLPGEPRNRVRAALALGTALVGRGKARAAVEALRTLDDELTGRPDLVRTVQNASALLSDHDQAVRQEVYRCLSDTAERSPELIDTAGQALLVRHAATAGLTSAQDAMKRVLALLAEPADPLTEPFLLGTAAAVAQWADELDEAERLVARGLAGQRPSLLHPMHRALLDTRTDIAAARGDHVWLLAGADNGAWPVERGSGPSNADAHTLLALVETGRTEEAWRLADAFELSRAPDSWELNRFLYARGVLRAATGDPAGALHEFLECGRRQAAREVVSPVVTPWRTAAAECRLALGSPEEALALAEEELRLARVWNTPRTVGRSLRVLGTATGGRRGLELVDEAVRILRDADVDTELIPALLAQGRRFTAAGERARARDCLREAAERAERLGAVRLRTLAEEALRVGGARRPATPLTGSGSLTDSERRIARLAADGRTNTEIADLLHLARRTVETHLTSTYRKLRIRRRAELPTALGRETRAET